MSATTCNPCRDNSLAPAGSFNASSCACDAAAGFTPGPAGEEWERGIMGKMGVICGWYNGGIVGYVFDYLQNNPDLQSCPPHLIIL